MSEPTNHERTLMDQIEAKREENKTKMKTLASHGGELDPQVFAQVAIQSIIEKLWPARTAERLEFEMLVEEKMAELVLDPALASVDELIARAKLQANMPPGNGKLVIAGSNPRAAKIEQRPKT